VAAVTSNEANATTAENSATTHKLFDDVVSIIENRKSKIVSSAIAEGTIMFWEVGRLLTRKCF